MYNLHNNPNCPILDASPEEESEYDFWTTKDEKEFLNLLKSEYTETKHHRYSEG